MKKIHTWLGSQIWSTLNKYAREAQSQGWIEAVKLPARVISIGNLQAGGTGKTPLTIYLAKQAVARDLQVAILTRGYRSVWEKTGGVISPLDPTPSPYLCGDEVALMRQQVKEAWIGVGADRVVQFEKLQSVASIRGERQFDLIILEDGFQNLKIKKDLDIVAITSEEFGNKLFRDKTSALQKNNLVILTKGDEFPQSLNAEIPRAIVKYKYPKPSMDRYLFVCALADPFLARESLLKAGFKIQSMASFADHHPYTADEVRVLLKEAEGQGWKVLLTGKDWVKWKDLGVLENLVTVVEPEIEFVSGENIWNQIVWKS